MTDYQASKLHNGDEVTVNETGTVTTVLQSYTDENGDTKVQTDYKGFTEFYPDEIS